MWGGLGGQDERQRLNGHVEDGGRGSLGRGGG